MTERKPPGVAWQTWIDRQIEEGRARGDFDGLPGTGKPIDGLDAPRDELWWVRQKLKAEGLDYLPPSLAILREADLAREKALRAPSEREARRILDEVNQHIRHLNSHMCDGPPTTLAPLDTEALLALWREGRRSAAVADGGGGAGSGTGRADGSDPTSSAVDRTDGQTDGDERAPGHGGLMRRVLGIPLPHPLARLRRCAPRRSPAEEAA